MFYENLGVDEHDMLTYIEEQLDELVSEQNTTLMMEIGTESEISSFLHEATSILGPIVKDMFETADQTLTPEFGKESTSTKSLLY